MAFKRGRFALTAPRFLTVMASAVLVAAALASMHLRLPVGQGFVAQHRFWVVIAGYAVLMLGIVLPGL